MVTGDKGATAHHIGVSCGIFEKGMTVHTVKEDADIHAELEIIRGQMSQKMYKPPAKADEKKVSDEEMRVESTMEYGAPEKNQGLLICGSSFPALFENPKAVDLFAEIMYNMKSIIIYRASPSQKG